MTDSTCVSCYVFSLLGLAFCCLCHPATPTTSDSNFWSLYMRCLIIRRFSHGKMYDAVLLISIFPLGCFVSTMHYEQMKDERYVLKVRDCPARTDKQLFGACGQAEHIGAICSGCRVGCFTVNKLLRCLNEIEARPPLPGGPFLVVFFHNRLQLLRLNMWTWME